jgi:hypothetical protein
VVVAVADGVGDDDIIRSEHDVEWLGLLNMVLVWGLCHRLGSRFGDLGVAELADHLSPAGGRSRG